MRRTTMRGSLSATTRVARPEPREQLDAYTAVRRATWSALDRLPVEASAAFRRDLVEHETNVAIELTRFRQGKSTLAALLDTIGAARARFATIAAKAGGES